MPRFKMRSTVLLLVCLLSVPAARSFQYTECAMRPDNDEENVIEDSKTVSLECSFDAEVSSCTIYHNEPEQDKNSAVYDFQ